MAFFETLRRVLGTADGQTPDEAANEGASITDASVDADGSTAGFDSASPYDRAQWHKKLQRILDELPDSRPEWDGLMTESKALGLDPTWVASCQVEEFLMLMRRAVADRVVSETEHRKLDMARELLGIPEPEAEAALHTIANEAASFFGGPVDEG